MFDFDRVSERILWPRYMLIRPRLFPLSSISSPCLVAMAALLGPRPRLSHRKWVEWEEWEALVAEEIAVALVEWEAAVVLVPHHLLLSRRSFPSCRRPLLPLLLLRQLAPRFTIPLPPSSSEDIIFYLFRVQRIGIASPRRACSPCRHHLPRLPSPLQQTLLLLPLLPPPHLPSPLHLLRIPLPLTPPSQHLLHRLHSPHPLR